MLGKLLISMIILLISSPFANSQQVGPDVKSKEKMIHDKILGISFAEVGKTQPIDSTGYSMVLIADKTGTGKTAMAYVLTSDQLFVDLPGSYGGRLFYTSPEAHHLLKNRILVDTVKTNFTQFVREYWTVYAGMGMWECVINCHTQKAGKYYLVAMIQDRAFGKPGEVIDGKRLSAEELQKGLLRSLQDTTDVAIQQFDRLLASFRIDK
ncbi:MAG: hypothetical protein ONB44_02250 [candidate division KSB1 bacterium]|nr:hypothetical protein [candidate division KSB1 bacterium]MDZ7300945.1 hypothetical protein [candidate division KSB1 bacterium]MDZ7310377.1 hypothetical protein [candidate division KSB1 bacterium]